MNRFFSLLKKVFTNKVVFYLLSRYFIYFLQFVASMIIAVKLGPYYLGIWGFILLLLNYFQQVNFGIATSLNVLLIHNKGDEKKSSDYIANSFALISVLAFVVILIACYYFYFDIGYLQKYDIGHYFYWICIVAILQYYNSLFVNIFRINNRLTEIIINQSLIVVLSFVFSCIFSGDILIELLIAGYIAGNIISLFFFLRPKLFSLKIASVSKRYMKDIMNKGFYLFVYNCCFYFIIISIRTIVSYYYAVDDFGYFTFSFTLANAIMLLLDAFSFLIYPKIVSKLSSRNKDEVESTLERVRTDYISFSHGLIYIAILLFPLILFLFPKYSSALQTLNLIALSVLLSTNSFGYATLLIARNKENVASYLSLFALLCNVVLGIGLAKLGCQYQYIIIATMITYVMFSFTVVAYGKKLLGSLSWKSVLKDFFPLRLFLPFLTAVIIAILHVSNFLFLPICLYVLLNYKEIVKMRDSIKTVLNNQHIINL